MGDASSIRGLVIAAFLATLLILVLIPARAASCTDTDGGKDLYVQGTVTSSNGKVYTDVCSSEPQICTPTNCPPPAPPKLVEFSCDGENATRETVACPGAGICSDGACMKGEASCTDTDGGRDFANRGEVTTNILPPGTVRPAMKDYCSYGPGGQTLFEYYCVGVDNSAQPRGNVYCETGFCESGLLGSVWREEYVCPGTCAEGRCIDAPVYCNDSDGSMNPYVKGTVTYSGGDVFTDVCESADTVMEGYCQWGTLQTYARACAKGCADGACISECPDSIPTNCSETGASVAEYIRDARGCVISYRCVESSKRVCPDLGPPACPAAYGVRKVLGSDGCLTAYECVPPEKPPATTTTTKECAKEGALCSGIAGTLCCEGLTCVMKESSPDASGTCVPLPSEKPVPAPATERGVRNAYWKCQDGSESYEGGTTSCKTANTWKSYAEEACAGRCDGSGEKCGVNSFEIWGPCYGGSSACSPSLGPAECEAAGGNYDKCPSACAEKPLSAATDFSEFASCLSNKGVKVYLIEAEGCAYCVKQLDLFGGNARSLLKVVECGTLFNQSESCTARGVGGYPTWEFADGSLEAGFHSLEQLGGKSGCAGGRAAPVACIQVCGQPTCECGGPRQAPFCEDAPSDADCVCREAGERVPVYDEPSCAEGKLCPMMAVRISYACRKAEVVKTRLGEPFSLGKGWTAVVADYNEMRVKLAALPTGGDKLIAQLVVTMPGSPELNDAVGQIRADMAKIAGSTGAAFGGETGAAIAVRLAEGESADLFGVTLKAQRLSTDEGSFLVERKAIVACPEYVKCGDGGSLKACYQNGTGCLCDKCGEEKNPKCGKQTLCPDGKTVKCRAGSDGCVCDACPTESKAACGNGACEEGEGIVCRKPVSENAAGGEVCYVACPEDCGAIGNSSAACVDGCAAGARCLPYGTRRVMESTPAYCDQEGGWQGQLADGASCQNNYECETNACSSGKCADLEKEIAGLRGIIQKLLSLLGSLFGRNSG